MTPRFEKKYLEIDKLMGKEIILSKIGQSTLKVYKDFFEQNQCDSKVFYLLGENLYRFFHDKPSLQMESGVYED
ncbi:hypothetical protein [Thalassobellus citreus]|uniref:hypothetical protein n=1 Tax=Thalassobellus citreus TaxID=3367752 RepID=UPI003788FDC7